MSSPETSGINSSKPRLTELEKKQNHILSEKKRRDAIRAGFDRIADIVPGMKGQGRSEAVVLGATVKYLRELEDKKETMRRKWVASGRSEKEFNSIFKATEKEVQDRVEADERLKALK